MRNKKNKITTEEATHSVNITASELKERFKEGSIPLQTDFSDLIDFATVKPGVGIIGDNSGMQVKPGPGIIVDNSGVRIDPENVLPRGIITMFSGSTAPAGWAFCDGKSGTPDLRDRFIVGKGSQFSESGGGSTATDETRVTGDVSVQETRLTLAQIPSHNHGYGYWGYGTRRYNGNTWESNYVSGWVTSTTGYSGGGQGHSHAASLATDLHRHTFRAIPPYYALAFIMKL